jgi:hypothetical protein
MALNSHNQKRCTCCKTIYPRTAEYFHAQGPGKPLRAVCKVCVNAGRRETRTYQVIERPKCRMPIQVFVVENRLTGKRRALRYWEDGPGAGEIFVGVGTHLLNLGE